MATPSDLFTKLDERDVYDGHVISVAVGRFEGPDGEELERDIVHHPGAVSVVPIVGDEVVLVRQFRAAPNVDLLEIPAGKRDVEGEPPEVTAARELEEEVGLRAKRLHKVAEFYNSAGFCDELSHVFVATDLEDVPRQAIGVEEEHMTIERVPLAEIRARIARFEIVDAKTIIGLLLALDHLGE